MLLYKLGNIFFYIMDLAYRFFSVLFSQFLNSNVGSYTTVSVKKKHEMVI